jgi:heme-degrading monooxygenase HmoA
MIEMIAKLRTVEVPPQDVDAGVAYLRNQMLPAAREVDGFHGMIGLVDRETGKAVTVTLWASAEALQASEDAGARLRAGGGAPPHRAVVERFEVVVSEVVGLPAVTAAP